MEDFTNEELVLLRGLAKDHLDLIKSHISVSEESISDKGRNANSYSKISAVEILLRKIDNLINK